MIRRPPRSTLFPTRRSSDLRTIDQRINGLIGQTPLPNDLAGDRINTNGFSFNSPSGSGEKLFGFRSEEHTSELQSQSNLVCRLLLEKKNKLNALIERKRNQL